MSNKRYELGKAPHIFVAECTGDLVVRGWGDSAVLVKGAHDGSEEEGMLKLRAQGSLQLRVPAGSTLSVKTVHGDLLVKGVEGELHLPQVVGDLALKSVGAVDVGTVHGDLTVRQANGPVQLVEVMGDLALRNVGAITITTVHGDLSARYVDGDVRVEEVMGDVSLYTVNGNAGIRQGHRDVNLNNLSGSVEVAEALGDIRLVGGLAPGKHHLTARGDVVIRWPTGSALNVIATAPRVMNRLPLESVQEEEGRFSGQIGDGDTTLILSAGGRVVLKEIDAAQRDVDFTAEWTFGTDFAEVGAELAGLGAEITNELNAHLNEFSRHLDERLGPDFAQKMADHAAQKAERAVQRAMRQAERARKQAGAWTPAPTPRKARKEPQASTDEQMKILDMLEKGIISVEEADTLLKALEG